MSTPNNNTPGEQPDRDEPLYRAIRLVAGDLLPTDPPPFEAREVRQPAEIDKRVILQNVWWIDRRARWRHLEDMSRTYRTNVLSHLCQEGGPWVASALAKTYFSAIFGFCSTDEARDRLALLALLTPGWTHHTPLSIRLHQLNGTNPEPLTIPPNATAAASDTPDLLNDNDGGLWEVTTASTTRYAVDLDRRKIIRQPGTEPDSSHTNDRHPDLAHAPIAALPGDGEWMNLTDLVHCRVGYSLLIFDRRPTGPGYRISTPVVGIRRLVRPDRDLD